MPFDGADKPREQEANDKFLVKAPKVALLKRGGTIHVMGEKYAANPMTGTGSISVPLEGGFGRSWWGHGNDPQGLGEAHRSALCAQKVRIGRA
jgi:hypothetical protein